MKYSITMLIAAAALQVLTAGLCSAQEFGLKLKLDHFAFYKANASPRPPGVLEYQGQFDKEPQPLRKAGLKFIGFPTGKDGAKVIQKKEFLAFCGVRVKKEPKREVLIQNQFGEQRLVTGNVVGLLVPSVDFREDPPKVLDHYIVYDVVESDPSAIDREVALSDLSGESRCNVTKNVLFCVPITKIHNGKTTKIQNPEGHLTLYAVKSPETKPTNFRYKNQFVDEDAGRTDRVYLALPTIKVEWALVK